MPGCKSSAAASHSLSHSALAAPLTLARTHSGWYLPERGNRSEVMPSMVGHQNAVPAAKIAAAANAVSGVVA